jgi:GTPase SAR1 family protein
LKNLIKLDLGDNLINSFPRFWIEQFKHFEAVEFSYTNEGINLHGNPLEDPPMEVVAEGREAIARYFERKENEIFDIVNEVKLIFVGDGAAGKTSLKLRLKNPAEKLPEGDVRTRGIDISDWEFDDKFVAHIWDFGGQDVYYPVHRFFITENSLFILLASTRNEQHNFEYWIPTIYQFGGDSPIIIGQTCFDGNKMPWNDVDAFASNPKFNVVRNGTSSFYQFNLKSEPPNEGLDKLKEEIISQAKKLPHCRKGIPKSWIDVRDKLSRREVLCIHYAEFENICREVNPKSFSRDADIEDCCTFFHNIGFLCWYRQNNVLREWVILKPVLAVDAVYKIIDDSEVQGRFGHITPDDFKRLWSDDKYKNYRSVLQEMLKEFRISFPKKDSDKYVMPALLKSMPPKKMWSETQCVTLEYVFKFMPRAIVNQLSAELSRYISIEGDDEEVWNNAVNFVCEGSICQVKEDFSDKKIIIKAKGAESRLLVMSVMDALDIIVSDKNYRGIEYNVMIPCTCSECSKDSENREEYKYAKLKRLRKEKGREVVRCNESDEDVPISRLLYDVGLSFSPDTRERRGNLQKIKIFLASSKELAGERKDFEVFISRLNDKFVDSGVYLSLETWEKAIDAMSETRLQDEYNKMVKESDIFVGLFFTKAGRYTVEEFDAAYKQFKESGKPRVYTYFKDLSSVRNADNEDLISLIEFEKRLKDLGHFPTRYEDINDLKNKFRFQLDEIDLS